MSEPSRKRAATVIAVWAAAASVMWGFMVAVFCMGVFGWNPYVVWAVASCVASNALVYRIALMKRRGAS